MTVEPGRSRVPLLLVLVGALLGAAALTGLLVSRDSRTAGSSSTPAAPAVGLEKSISQAQDKLRRNPDDSLTWAELGSAYVEEARIVGDPSYYPKSQGALERSLAIKPADNGEAMIGMGKLANARHDFVTGKDWGEKARASRPYSAAVYGVLADAYTQLGDTQAATAAVQKMLDTSPGLPALTRASYDLELHGRVDDARSALQRALGLASSVDDVAFCRYYLGELAWNAGRVDEASDQYEQGLAIAPQNVALLQGRAKVAWARGHTDDALAGYAALTNRVPLPQYVLEYAELAQSAGRTQDATAQLQLLTAQDQLYQAQGSNDDVVGALVAADHGDPAVSLRRAQAEWGRRQSVFSADALAWALHVNGRDAEALSYADKADALGWRNAGHAFHRGMILAGLGRRADALTALRTSLEINPYFNPLQAPVARTTIAKLEAGS